MINVTHEAAAQMDGVAALATEVEALRARCADGKTSPIEPSVRGEIIANLTLAIRHLEDAESRLMRAWSRMK